MQTYKEFRQMQMQMNKQANGFFDGTAAFFSNLFSAVPEAIKATSDVINTGALYLLAASAITGGLGGYAVAKATAHSKDDLDLVKKEYENHRLASDIGYIQGSINREQALGNRKNTPKAARVLG